MSKEMNVAQEAVDDVQILRAVQVFIAGRFGEHDSWAMAVSRAADRLSAHVAAAPGIDLAVLREELAGIVNDWRGPGPKTGLGGCCVACGRWTPWGNPEAHDHDDNCPEHAEWGRRRHWQQRIVNLIALIDASPKGEQSGNSGELER